MKTVTGKVVSLKNKATALVEVENHFKHPLYKKYLTRTKKYACHLEPNVKVALNQLVTIASCRPVSKTKTFRVIINNESKTPKQKKKTS
jgi:small subunit ribosomal protein S17